MLSMCASSLSARRGITVRLGGPNFSTMMPMVSPDSTKIVSTPLKWSFVTSSSGTSLISNSDVLFRVVTAVVRASMVKWMFLLVGLSEVILKVSTAPFRALSSVFRVSL